jgi:DNA gyrase inhibitor GyrI
MAESALERVTLNSMTVVSHTHVGEFVGASAAWSKVNNLVAMKRLVSDQSMALGISHDNPETAVARVRYDACVNVDEATIKRSGLREFVKTAARRPVPNETGELSEPGEPSGPNLVEFQGGEFLRVVHRGSYVNLPATFHRLLKLAKDGGIDIEPLPLIQIYRNSPNFTPEAELETEVLVRVKHAKK